MDNQATIGDISESIELIFTEGAPLCIINPIHFDDGLIIEDARMKLPQIPPDFEQLFQQASEKKRLDAIIRLAEHLRSGIEYYHWDELRRHSVHRGFTHEEWWCALKLKRRAAYLEVPLTDKKSRPFHYFIPENVQRLLHEIDFGAGAYIGMPDPIANPQTRDRYLVSSLIQEAITSSQLEGAVTTREVAKEMIRSGRTPRDKSERMILNNYLTMQEIIRVKDQPMTVPLLQQIHGRVTDQTLDKPTAAGRFRRSDEPVKVVDGEGQIYHEPPPAEQLQERAERLCAFANGTTPSLFVPPVIRAIILHFCLAYDHPFVDGNGRTARALFYWSMLRQGFWLFEFISISNILVKAPSQYARAFLFAETDDNDLNYFILHQADVIRRAIEALHAYIDRKQKETRAAETRLKVLRQLNHRQQALIAHALRHPGQEYAVASHQRSHGVAYATARADLLGLVGMELLIQAKRGKTLVFAPAHELSRQLDTLSKAFETNEAKSGG
jgi:Fic family protein